MNTNEHVTAIADYTLNQLDVSSLRDRGIALRPAKLGYKRTLARVKKSVIVVIRPDSKFQYTRGTPTVDKKTGKVKNNVRTYTLGDVLTELAYYSAVQVEQTLTVGDSVWLCTDEHKCFAKHQFTITSIRGLTYTVEHNGRVLKIRPDQCKSVNMYFRVPLPKGTSADNTITVQEFTRILNAHGLSEVYYGISKNGRTVTGRVDPKIAGSGTVVHRANPTRREYTTDRAAITLMLEQIAVDTRTGAKHAYRVSDFRTYLDGTFDQRITDQRRGDHYWQYVHCHGQRKEEFSKLLYTCATEGMFSDEDVRIITDGIPERKEVYACILDLYARVRGTEYADTVKQLYICWKRMTHAYYMFVQHRQKAYENASIREIRDGKQPLSRAGAVTFRTEHERSPIDGSTFPVYRNELSYMPKQDEREASVHYWPMVQNWPDQDYVL